MQAAFFQPGHGVGYFFFELEEQRCAAFVHLHRAADRIVGKTFHAAQNGMVSAAAELGFLLVSDAKRDQRRIFQVKSKAGLGRDRRFFDQTLRNADHLERALEVIRISKGLIEESPVAPESSFAFYLEDPSLVTLGIAYEQKPKFGGGAYHPVLRRVESFSDDPIRSAMKVHERRAALLLELEEKVADAVARLKKRGLQSPYLRSFVVARINPLRWIKGDFPPAEKVLETMRDRAARFNTEKVKQQDLAGGFAPVADEE